MSATDFEIDSDGVTLRGSREGEGQPIVLAHGLTAHRDLVVHGSRALPRAGYELIRYDARGHGESDVAAPGGYTYDRLAEDLGQVIDQTVGEEGPPPVLVGHSMGAHSVVNLALRDPSRYAGLVLIGPASVGVPLEAGSRANWDALADGLERNGIDGFIAAYEIGLDPGWSETLIRIARDRLAHHRDLDAVAEAVREVPRSVPFEGMSELATLSTPTLIVASHDVSDPGHPFAVAEAYAGALPDATIISEAEGESPLAWQGGRLSREIGGFCAQRSTSR